jgi:hypothetical protein
VRPRLDTRPTEQLDHPLIERRPRGNPPSAHRAGPVGRLVVCVKFCKSDQGSGGGCFFIQGVILTTATGAGEATFRSGRL